MRILLAALLNSGLSIRELNELAEEMTFSPAFLFTFKTLLKDIGDRISEPSALKVSPPGNKPPSEVDNAYSIIQRRRLSKRELSELMSTAARGFHVDEPNPKASVRDVLRKFFHSASSDERQKFMALLQPPTGSDEYLRGIVRKS